MDNLVFRPIKKKDSIFLEVQEYWDDERRGVLTITPAEWAIIKPMLVWAASWYLKGEVKVTCEEITEAKEDNGNAKVSGTSANSTA